MPCALRTPCSFTPRCISLWENQEGELADPLQGAAFHGLLKVDGIGEEQSGLRGRSPWEGASAGNVSSTAWNTNPVCRSRHCTMHHGAITIRSPSVPYLAVGQSLARALFPLSRSFPYAFFGSELTEEQARVLAHLDSVLVVPEGMETAEDGEMAILGRAFNAMTLRSCILRRGLV